MKCLAVTLVYVLSSGLALAAEPGIVITPDDEGVFEYDEDFATPKFLADAVSTSVPADRWAKGAISNTGPHRNRTVTYRFFGSRTIESVEIRVEQRANARHLGAKNHLYVSANGLDWTSVASSATQEGDGNGWQAEPLVLSPEHATALVGGTEVWVRVVLDNYCGLKTHTSNIVSGLQVKLHAGASAGERQDPQAALRATWADLREQAGWQSISLDWADPAGQRAPHYYEDADGWLQEPDGEHRLALDESSGFTVRRAHLPESTSPLSLAAFVATDKTTGPVMARIEVLARPDSSREMAVLWDGVIARTFEGASAIEEEQVLFAQIPGPQAAGAHELRLAPQDSGALVVRRVTLAGSGTPRWAERPAKATGSALHVLGVQYIPDPLPPPASQVVEGRQKKPAGGPLIQGMQRLYEEHAEFGALRVVVRNDDAAPVRVKDLALNGKPIEESYVDFTDTPWDAPGVVWYRIRPRLLQPRQCGQITVRFRRRPPGERAEMRALLESGASVDVQIPYTGPGVALDYVTTGVSMDTLYVYARRADPAAGRVTRVSLDGQALDDAAVHGPDFPGGVALAVAKLDRPLARGAYHVVGVATDGGRQVAAQFRVLPFVFPRSSIHVPPALCKQMHMNVAMWYQQSLETCRKHDLFTTTGGSMFGLHERVAFVIGPDEPDAHDNRGGGYANGLGYHARRLAHSGWQELIERFAPQASSWIIMNGTVRPLNWCVYGRFADICCFDPYPINFYGADHAYVRESLEFARLCGTPNRLYACLEAFGWGKGQGVPKKARGPSPIEWRQNVVQAIGCGMKGLTSWVYSAGAGGWQINEGTRKEIAATNALIAHVEDELLLGTPIDLVTCDAGAVPTGVVGNEAWPKERVWVGSLLCGPDTIVIAAANHIPSSKPDPPTVEPAKDVTITVRLPDYLRTVKAFEATPEGEKPFACVVKGGQAVLRVPSIESGRVFVLRRQADASAAAE